MARLWGGSWPKAGLRAQILTCARVAPSETTATTFAHITCSRFQSPQFSITHPLHTFKLAHIGQFGDILESFRLNRNAKLGAVFGLKVQIFRLLLRVLSISFFGRNAKPTIRNGEMRFAISNSRHA
jgi:hypothetical protein